MNKSIRNLVLSWGCVLLALGWGAKEAQRIPAAAPLASYTSAADTVTYGDNRIVYTVDVDTATNSDGQLLYILDLSAAPVGMRARYLMKPDFDSVMVITEDTFAMSPTDSATAKARAASWGVQDPFLVILSWREPDPDPVTNFALVMSEDTLVASWTETSGTYQVEGGLNSGSGQDYTDTVSSVGENKHVVTAFGSYWSCAKVLDGGQVSDSRCNNVNYDSVGGGDPPSVNDPVWVENFESWSTTTWRLIDGSGGFGTRNPYNLKGDTVDHFIETTGSPEGSNHLRLFRASKSSAGAGCNNNTIGFEIESGNSPSYKFGAIMGGAGNQAHEFWIEFYVKFDASPSPSPWGTAPDTAWSCSSAPDHKLLRMYVDGGSTGNYWAWKEGHFVGNLWSVGPARTGGGDIQNENNAGGAGFWWDNEWHLMRLYGKRSSSSGVSDGIAQFTIDSAGTRIIINKEGRIADGRGQWPYDEIDVWWSSWLSANFGLNRNHWTDHDAQFRFDNIRIWIPVANGGNGGPGWVGAILENP